MRLRPTGLTAIPGASARERANGAVPLRWTALRASGAHAEQPTGCVTSPAVEREDLLRATYEAFNARDIDAVLRHMTAEVDWPNAWEGLNSVR